MVGRPVGVKFSACFCMSGLAKCEGGQMRICVGTARAKTRYELHVDKLISNHVVTRRQISEYEGKSNKMEWVGKVGRFWPIN